MLTRGINAQGAWVLTQGESGCILIIKKADTDLVKTSPAMQETWVPFLGRSPGEVKVYPLQCSGLENPMDCIVHGVAKSRTRLSDFHFNMKKVNLC